MNIFLLDYAPTLAAQYHSDKHVVKMVLETAQILCTSLHINDAPAHLRPYKPTHQQHPSTLWASQKPDNAHFLARLGLALAAEYTYRYQKIHKSQPIIAAAYDYYAGRLSATGPDFANFPQCMPAEYQVPGCPVKAYRAYYLSPAKQRIHAYSRGREAPRWA